MLYRVCLFSSVADFPSTKLKHTLLDRREVAICFLAWKLVGYSIFHAIICRNAQWKITICRAVASQGGGGGGEREGGPPWVLPLWGDTILWCETITPPICGEYLTLFGRSILIWTKNPLIFRRRPFLGGLHILLDLKPTYFATIFFFFWSSPIFGTKKGATTKSRPGCYHF